MGSNLLPRLCGAILLAAALVTAAAHGAAPSRLRDYTHTTWTARNGAPAEVHRMAQTADGMLWLSTPSSLYRFDGVSFSAYTMPPGAEELKRIRELRARPNGELWIADVVGGLYVLKDGRVRNVSPPQHHASMRGIAFDPDGSVWAAMTSGLMHYDGKSWRRVDFEGEPPREAWSVLADQYGQVWTANAGGVYLLDRASRRFRYVMATGDEASDLIASPDGQLWLAGGGRVAAVPMPPQQAMLARPADENGASSRPQGQFDRAGNLWSLQCGPGICHVPQAAGRVKRGAVDLAGAEHLAEPWQLTSPAVNGVFEDREGNIWLATQNGIDRFRSNKVKRIPIADERGVYSMARDSEGNVWVAEPYTSVAWRVPADGGPAVADRSEPFTVVANDRDGALLLAGRRALVRRHLGKETRLPLPAGPGGKPMDLTVFGVLDDGKVLWIGALETGLMGYVDGAWRPRSAFNMPPKVFVSAHGGRPGTLWLGCGDGSVVFYDQGRLTTYDAGMVGMFTAVLPGPELVAAGVRGIAVLHDKRFVPLHADEPDVLQGVTGLAVTPNGDRWLNGSRGIVQVRAADWREAMANPERPLRYRLIGSEDGYPGSAMTENRLHSIFVAPDGQMWFMAGGGIVRLDPAAVPHNPVPPQVSVTAVTAAGVDYPATGLVRLPPGTHSFQVSFAAPSLVRADGVQFEYRLAGVDAGWQEGGARRSARYTNVQPGSYLFSVRAVNEDAVEGERHADVVVEVAPTVTQTWWFRGTAGLLAAAALYLLYRYRLHRALARTAEQHEVRMAERERIARTLHDTFLQSVQAVILRVQAVALELPEGSDARAKLENVLDQADRTLDEGRDQVHELRSSGDIVPSLQRAGEALQAEHPAIAFTLEVSGRQRRLQPQAGEELQAIALEALRNAFRHAGGTHVDVHVRFADDGCAIRIADDGRGMTEGDVRQRIAEGHWGMLGMRERAARIGATLAVDSAPGRGTTVEASLPSRLAYLERKESRVLS